MAKIFAKKFTIISPVWFQLKPIGYEIDGVHNIDYKWMESVKLANSNITFAPRVIFEQWNAGDFQKVLTNSQYRLDCIKALRNLCRTHGFNGLTLEVWMQHFGTSQQVLMDFLIELAKGLHIDAKFLILPIPPSIYKGNFEGRFGRAHFDVLAKYVDYFSLMTYDYSNPYSPGENAPLEWVTRCVKNLVPDDKDIVKRARILTGINFYGYDYTPSQRDGRAVVSHEVVDIAKKFSPKFKWHTSSSEHSMEYIDEKGNEHSLYFPTIYSIAKRVAMVEDMGTGLSVWEIGQGFESFYDQI
nr:Glycoside hydrolase chitinase domain containing protein 1 [Hymenolepis microstoma]